MELYQQVEQTPRNYYVMTELFVMLHGSDVCPMAKGVLQPAENKESIESPNGYASQIRCNRR